MSPMRMTDRAKRMASPAPATPSQPAFLGHLDRVGRRIHLGSTVACARSGYAELTLGTVVAATAHKLRVEVAAKMPQQPGGPRSLSTGETFLVFPSQVVALAHITHEEMVATS